MLKQVKLFGRELKIKVFDEADLSVFEEVFVDRDYQFAEDLIKKSQILIDVGAHKGYFSVFASVLNPDLKILAFEPEEFNFKVLKENLHDNRIKNVVPKNLAISGIEGEAFLNLSSDSHNHSLIFPGEGKKKIKTISLENILNRKTAEDFVFVKIDAEGSEFEILRQCSSKTFSMIDVFLIEYHEFGEGFFASELIEILKKNNYRIEKRSSYYDKRMGMIKAIRL